MSETLYQAFNAEQADLLTRFEARRIITGVKEARDDPENAGRRWPFELLQNAHDAGPYSGRNSVDVSIVLTRTGDERTRLIFEHDGAPFAVRELVALLSGGSSKEFESDETTGRFGTGFLVTHVLSTQVRVRGILTNADSLELFDLELNRAGDEDEIVKNIDVSKSALRDALKLEKISEEKAASFEYEVENVGAATNGILAVRECLPYLFATCPNFGSFVLRDGDELCETWRRDETKTSTFEDRTINDILLIRRTDKGVEDRYRSIAVNEGEGTPQAVIAAAMIDGVWRLHLPGISVPRIFRRLPIQSYPVPIVPALDGNFDVRQDRQALPLNEDNKHLLSRALGNIPAMIQFAYRENWEAKHLLARVEVPHRSAYRNQDEFDWWKGELRIVAETIASLPLVLSRGRLGPGLNGEDWSADFVLPRLNSASSDHTVALDRAWPLIDAITDLDPPELSIASDWTITAQNWSQLGLEVSLVALEDIAAHLRNVGGLLDKLPISGDKNDWLVSFLDVIGECWTEMKGEHPAALDGLLPDQLGILRGHKELLRDAGIPESLKDIAHSLGIEIREKLFETKIIESARSTGVQYFSGVLEKLLPSTLTEEELIEQCIAVLNKKLIEDKQAPNDPNLKDGSVRLLSHLWGTKGQSGEALAKKCPLIAMDGTVVKWSSTRMMMAPPDLWHPEARPFQDAYPHRRILSSAYADSENSKVGSALVSWGIAIRDPLTKSSPPELKDKRLQGLTREGADTEGVTVSGVEFSQIALLTDAVLLHCQEDVDYAKLLLGLVLRYIANQDDQWRVWRDVDGTKDRKRVQITLRGAVWVADLTTRAWVPVEAEGETTKAFAKAVTIRDLLDPDWLIDNERGAELLSECFGFDSLDSRLLGVETSKRQEVRDRLARLLDIAKSDPDTLSEFADQVEARESRKRDVGKWRRFGLAVQDAVQASLEGHGLTVNVVDCGFDFEVLLNSDCELEEADLARLEIGPYFMEVKATTQGEVKMTPTQASHAALNVERYALCVIDLRAIPEDELDRVWAADEIENLSHVVTNIGTYTIETTELIETAKGNEVGIRNESALRYGVPTAIWNIPFSLQDWVESIVEILKDKS